MDDDKKWWTRWVVRVVGGWLLVVIGLFVVSRWMRLERGDAFALGQVVIEAILFPLAVLGFMWTYREVRNVLAPEMLDLGWDDYGAGVPPKHATMQSEVEPESVREGRSICLFNSGKAVARWFTVEIVLPAEVCIIDKEMEFAKEESWEPSGATDGGAWLRLPMQGSLRVVFTSNGAVASFPKVRLQLGTVWHEAGGVPIGEFRIPFTVHTERGAPVDGALTVKVESPWGN